MDAQYSSTWGKVKHVLNKYSKFIGSSIMISVAYIDPGNYATGTTAGATNKYSLLFIVLVANIIAIFLQSICIKLGSVTGFDLARCCREYLPKKVNWVLWFFAECAIIATDIAEVIGTAIALNILLKIPLPAGVVITIVDVLFVLMAYKSDTASVKFLRYFELFVGLLVIGVTVCFAIELSKLPIQPGEVKEILRGYAPSRQMIEGPGITVAASIMGATVMIHSLFLGSGIVQPRLREYDAKHGYINLNQLEEKNQADEFFYNQYKPSLESIRYSLKFFIIELIVTLCTFALFINSSILVIAGNTLFGTDEAVDADLYTIHKLLSENLAPVVGTIFMLALLFSGQSAGIVCTIAGQIVSEGHINWTVKPWLRRLITRGISIIPVLGISIGIGRGGLNLALNVSQLIISLLLPILTLPLIYFTSSKKIMQIAIPKNRVLEDVTTVCSTEGTSEENEEEYAYFHNSWLTMIVLIAIWLFVSVINVYAIYDLSKNGFMN
ncbi:manganese transporter Smf1p [[Candida] jaroonii]|uniref:Manganese transporter Smf1p n=1 Tax=[Candida] jaroonii TaxID=467808 RepID=A0ACA9Y5V4_9ASCO|nr:manganese transporter Smf1p [[Candida] jaroonii]